MNKPWQVQEAKAKFCELLEKSQAEGPQFVTKRGVVAAVLVPIDQWEKMKQTSRPDLKKLLLTPEARTENLAPRREKRRHRSSPTLD